MMRITKKAYETACRKLDQINDTQDAESWNLLMFGGHPDTELQGEVDRLFKIIWSYEEAQGFAERIACGDYLLG